MCWLHAVVYFLGSNCQSWQVLIYSPRPVSSFIMLHVCWKAGPRKQFHVWHLPHTMIICTCIKAGTHAKSIHGIIHFSHDIDFQMFLFFTLQQWNAGNGLEDEAIQINTSTSIEWCFTTALNATYVHAKHVVQWARYPLTMSHLLLHWEYKVQGGSSLCLLPPCTWITL